jgi:B12-binding domain/radical SAM domain protein
MTEYDVLLIHPPAIYDFREKPIFPGPVAYNVGGSTDQFIIPPIGMLSIADYLDRNGYKVLVDNIGERMLTVMGFDAEEYIRSLSAKVYAIGLHWCVHSQGAIEIARLCKQLHPEAMVVLGGLTATDFHEEILLKYGFVDAVIRGEAEKPFLCLMQALEGQQGLESVPNLMFRDGGDGIRSVPLMEPSVDLDEFEFTRLDLLEPKQSLFPPGVLPHWSIPICRGCTYNCVSCGGSAYSYKTYFGRVKPAFRSPERIAEDIHKLSAQGVQLVYLFQDPRMGGKPYWTSLVHTLQKERFPISQLTMELFAPANERYIRELSKIDVPVMLSISPESCVDTVKKAHGRSYTNKELFRTVELCKKYGIRLGVFSMIALAEDTHETIRETWERWEEICSMNLIGKAPVDYAFGPMILLDPGSLAFDSPASYGYRLLFKNLEDYIRGMSLPAWHQWISYETEHLDREQITKLIIDSLEYSINLRERCGFYNRLEADTARYCFVKASKETIDMVKHTMNLQDEDEKLDLLRWFRESLDRNIPHLELESHWPKRYDRGAE